MSKIKSDHKIEDAVGYTFSFHAHADEDEPRLEILKDGAFQFSLYNVTLDDVIELCKRIKRDTDDE